MNLYKSLQSNLTKESSNELPDDLLSYLTDTELTEAPNPENAEANELIRKCLVDRNEAVKNAKALSKYGIEVTAEDYSHKPVDIKNFDEDHVHNVYLVGKNGRKLLAHEKRFSRNSVENIEYKHPDRSDYEDDTLYQKSYKDSRKEYKDAVEELPTSKKRLNLYNRRYGEDHERTRELKRDIKKAEETIKNGITAKQGVTTNSWGEEVSSHYMSPDADLKGYLDATKVKDRDYEDNLVYRNSTDSSYRGRNKAVSKYKWMRSQEDYNARRAEENKRRDAEDAERLEDYRKRFAEDKENRDKYLQQDIDATAKDRAEFEKRLADYKAKRARKGAFKDSEGIEKTYEIIIDNAFANYVICEWPATSAEEAVAQFKEVNPDYHNKGMITAREKVMKEAELPSATKLFDEIDAIVPATLVEDEEGITIELLDGTLKVDEQSVTFDAPWLPVNSRPLKFTSTTEFIACLEMMTSIFSSNKK